MRHHLPAIRTAPLVREPLRYLTNNLVRRHGTGRYHLRNGRALHVRHATGDLAIFSKVYNRPSYVPPSELNLPDAPHIIDAGANIGLFGLYALSRWPDAIVTAFEPDPANLKLLNQTVTANSLDDQWRVIPAAVGTKQGTITLQPGAGALSREDTEGSATVPVVDLFEQGPCDLLKLDVEGGEWAILTDPRIRTIPAIRLEWHRYLCPADDAHIEAIRLLDRAGFTRIINAEHKHPGNGVLWAWR